ncbi:hypothetical protein, partial [Enterococcus faecium]
GLRPDQVGFGIPANINAAGSGQLSLGDTQSALNCLIKGTQCGSYVPKSTYPSFRALMSWSVNWDKFNNFDLSTHDAAYFRSL